MWKESNDPRRFVISCVNQAILLLETKIAPQRCVQFFSFWLISKELAKHRDCRELSRALIAPVNGISGEREQLRYLHYAEAVASKTLFKRKRDDGNEEDEDGNESSTEVSSLLSRNNPANAILESILSMQALQTTILIVRVYFLLLFIC